MSDQGHDRSSLIVTAHHEAAHAAVMYRSAGYSDAHVTIIPDAGALGHSIDTWGDGFNPDDMEAQILSCYAGGHAQRRCDPTTGDVGCRTDDEIAAKALVEWGWEAREIGLRDRSRDLVGQHWAEIVTVATELLRVRTFDGTEVEIIADATAGTWEFVGGDDLATECTDVSRPPGATCHVTPGLRVTQACRRLENRELRIVRRCVSEGEARCVVKARQHDAQRGGFVG